MLGGSQSNKVLMNHLLLIEIFLYFNYIIYIITLATRPKNMPLLDPIEVATVLNLTHAKQVL